MVQPFCNQQQAFVDRLLAEFCSVGEAGKNKRAAAHARACVGMQRALLFWKTDFNNF